MASRRNRANRTDFQNRLGDIIFESDTPLAKLFDVVLLIAIVLSILLIMLESVTSYRVRYGDVMRGFEWVFTLLFTAEYVLRIYSAYDRPKYLRSFYGIVDLLAVLPAYLSLFFLGAKYFLVIRALRLLRVFRVLKLVHFLGEANTLSRAMRASRGKITVFTVAVVSIVIIIGSMMYVIEGPENGFSDIPTSVYWSIVTLTTVGYGDIAPQTPLGKFLAAVAMILGYGIIAVPTGIVTSEISRASHEERKRGRIRMCKRCHLGGHESDAEFCKYCGGDLPE